MCIERLKERDTGKVSETKIQSFGSLFNLPSCIWLAYVCAYICTAPLCVHACPRTCVCVCACTSMVEVLLPCNCGNDMSSTKKSSERVEWNATDTYGARTHTRSARKPCTNKLLSELLKLRPLEHLFFFF